MHTNPLPWPLCLDHTRASPPGRHDNADWLFVLQGTLYRKCRLKSVCSAQERERRLPWRIPWTKAANSSAWPLAAMRNAHGLSACHAAALRACASCQSRRHCRHRRHRDALSGSSGSPLAAYMMVPTDPSAKRSKADLSPPPGVSPCSPSAHAKTCTGTESVRNCMTSTKWHTSPTMRPPRTSGSCLQLSRGIEPAFAQGICEEERSLTDGLLQGHHQG